LTIKSNSNTKNQDVLFYALAIITGPKTGDMAALLVVNNARQIFDCQRSDCFTYRVKKSKIIFHPAFTRDE